MTPKLTTDWMLTVAGEHRAIARQLEAVGKDILHLAEWHLQHVAELQSHAAELRARDSTVEPLAPPPPPQPPPAEGWRERLWIVPAETRMDVSEVAEALGVGKTWVYERTGAKARRLPIPHKRLDDNRSAKLVFKAGELREWIEKYEEVKEAHPIEQAARRATKTLKLRREFRPSSRPDSWRRGLTNNLTENNNNE